MARIPRVLCVAWREQRPFKASIIDAPIGKVMWCAAAGELDPDARTDSTLCGRSVSFRIGSGRKHPTCPDCKRILKERAAEKSKPT